MQEILRQIFNSLFAVDSFWSVLFRGLIWLAIAVIIIVSSDNADPEKSLKSMKSNLGFFLMFILLSVGLMYLLFGFTTVPAESTTV